MAEISNIDVGGQEIGVETRGSRERAFHTRQLMDTDTRLSKALGGLDGVAVASVYRYHVVVVIGAMFTWAEVEGPVLGALADYLNRQKEHEDAK